MAVYSLIVNPETYKKMQEYYFKNEQQVNNNPHILKIYQINDLKIIIYKTYKVVFQGKTDSEAFQHYQYWNNIINNVEKQFNIIGSDEVGVGDFFGPLVVTACYLKPKNWELLEKLNIRDSKTLSDQQIKTIAPELIANIDYCTLIINNEHYNSYFKKYKNSHVIKAIGHNQVINKLAHKTNCHQAIIDQFASSDKYYEYLKIAGEKNFLHLTFNTQAESKFIVVACAAIISRFYFLEKILELEAKYGIKIVLGAGKKVDIALNKIFNGQHFIPMNKIAKLHFKNYQKLINKEGNNKKNER